MKLRTELEPKINQARKLYFNIKKRILDYTKYCDENGDKNLIKYKELESELKILTNKDISKFNLSEWWEEDGIENLSFNISLPKPNKITDITKKELIEIISKIKTFEESTNYENDEILMLLWANKDSYYRELLKVNFNNYEHKYFSRNKDKKGNYFEYSIDEIVEKFWPK